MIVRVEFFGIPRERLGLADVELSFSGDRVTLGDAITELTRRFPEFAALCEDGRRLRPEYIVNVSGERFVTAPEIVLEPGDSLLIMSADAGG